MDAGQRVPEAAYGQICRFLSDFQLSQMEEGSFGEEGLGMTTDI